MCKRASGIECVYGSKREGPWADWQGERSSHFPSVRRGRVAGPVMSDPLEDFNRRMTAGQGSWMLGPPKNAAESAAQAILDAQQRGAGTTSAGGIDIGARASATIVLAGIVLFSGVAYTTNGFFRTPSLIGMLIVALSGVMLLIGTIGLATSCIADLKSAKGWRNLFFAALAGLAAWWFSRWLWMMSFALVPESLIPFLAVALVFLITGRR